MSPPRKLESRMNFMRARVGQEMAARGRGAYGFRLVTRAWEDPLPGLLEADAEATEVALEWRHAASVGTLEDVQEDRLLLGGRGAALMEVRRDPAAILLDLPEAVSPEAIVHPVLTPPIAVLARWRGDLTLHA